MSDKIIAITGASSGIGEASARLLAKSGAKLVLGARRHEQLTTIAREIEADGGVAVPVALDVTSRDSMEAFVEQARSHFGRIDVLVNNAGVMLLAPLSDLRTSEWDRMIDVNIRGVLNGIAAALPHMKAQDSGHFVIVGSIAGRQVQQVNGVYAATKYAVRAIADNLRLEGGQTIRSTLISPGAVATELFDKILHPEIQQMAKSRIEAALPVEAVAQAIGYAIAQPPGVDINEIILRPMVHKY
jgi:NADP-dependent 3-hydroxy acid dehydrogenase YdfG